MSIIPVEKEEMLDSNDQFTKWTEIESIFKLSEILLTGMVVVTEKVHGTSVRFGIVNGVFRVGGRNEEFDFTVNDSKAGMGFVSWLHSHSDIVEKVKAFGSVKENVIFYGEWFGAGIQKGVKYFNGTEKGFLVFGVRINKELQSWAEIVKFSELIGVRTVPLLYSGKPEPQIFDALYVLPSQVALRNGVEDNTNLLEGIVISADPMQLAKELYSDSTGWLIAKYKNPKFAERMSEQKVIKVVNEAVIDQANGFVAEFWTYQRLEHVLSYLREKDIDVMSSKVIGPAIKGMFEDVMKEGSVEWQTLTNDAKKAVGKIHPSHTKELLGLYWMVR